MVVLKRLAIQRHGVLVLYDLDIQQLGKLGDVRVAVARDVHVGSGVEQLRATGEDRCELALGDGEWLHKHRGRNRDFEWNTAVRAADQERCIAREVQWTHRRCHLDHQSTVGRRRARCNAAGNLDLRQFDQRDIDIAQCRRASVAYIKVDQHFVGLGGVDTQAVGLQRNNDNKASWYWGGESVATECGGQKVCREIGGHTIAISEFFPASGSDDEDE
jgi:hypothetical protein